jgi:hypothetical protein
MWVAGVITWPRLDGPLVHAVQAQLDEVVPHPTAGPHHCDGHRSAMHSAPWVNHVALARSYGAARMWRAPVNYVARPPGEPRNARSVIRCHSARQTGIYTATST